MAEKKITIAYGNEIQLTTTGQKDKQVFIKFSPAFREKQLKELKGIPLSVFICYALHSDENGYTWIDDSIVKKETGYSETLRARQVLIKKGYLFQGRLKNQQGRIKDWIYRIFQPIEEQKKFIIRGEELMLKITKTDTGKSPLTEKDNIVIEEEPIIIKEEPVLATTSVAEPKERKDQDIFDLIELFKPINPTYERFFKNTTERVAIEQLLKKLGREKLEQLIAILPETNKMPYAPVITTPWKLQMKLGDLLAFMSKEKIKVEQKQDKYKIARI